MRAESRSRFKRRVGGFRPGCFIRKRFQVFQSYEPGKGPALTNDVRCGHMVGNAIDPGPQRTAAIVALETSPQLEMDLLDQVPAFFRVGLVSPGQPFERRTKLLSRGVIEGVLIGWPAQVR